MIFSDPNCFSSQLSQLRSGICTPNVRANYKSFQFTTLTDIVSKKLKELNESNELMSNNAPISPLEHINLPSPTATPVTPFNYLPTTPTRKSKTERRFNYNLTDSKMIKFVKGGGGKEINHAQNYFFSKYVNSESNNENPFILNLLPTNSEGKICVEKLKKEKFNQEMKYLENEDVVSSNNVSLVNQNMPHVHVNNQNNSNGSGNIKDNEKNYKNKGNNSPRKKGIWSLLNKLIAK